MIPRSAGCQPAVGGSSPATFSRSEFRSRGASRQAAATNRLAACAPRNCELNVGCRALNVSLSMSTGPFRVIAADHTGITVSNLERSLAFWRDVLGFELSHTAHQTDEMASEITGVEGAEIKLAVVKAPGGHKIELLNISRRPSVNGMSIFGPAMLASCTSRSSWRISARFSARSRHPVGKLLVNRKLFGQVRTPESGWYMFAIPMEQQSSSCSRRPKRTADNADSTDSEGRKTFCCF